MKQALTLFVYAAILLLLAYLIMKAFAFVLVGWLIIYAYSKGLLR